MNIERYRRRVNNESSMEAMKDTTATVINKNFEDTPNFKEVYVNGILTDARVEVDNDFTEKSVLFRPYTAVFKGDIIEFDSTHWLVTNIYEDELYPVAYVERCNEWLRWMDGTELLVYPAVVKEKSLSIEDGKYLITAESSLTILTPYNEDTRKIANLQRFILSEKPFEIQGVDAISDVVQGKGFLRIEAVQTLSEATDDLEQEVADNDNSDLGWGEW